MFKSCIAICLLMFVWLQAEEANSASRGASKTGVFNFVECEGGIGSAMHVIVTDPKTGEEQMMTAYKNAEGNICSLKSGTPVKITYRIEKESGFYTFLKYSMK